MRKNNKVLHAAEEQLVFGQSLFEMTVARDNLRIALPGCLLLELLEARSPGRENQTGRALVRGQHEQRVERLLQSAHHDFRGSPSRRAVTCPMLRPL
jgi:hypothetical protein